MRPLAPLLFVCLAFSALSGCGYRLGSAKPAMLQNVTKIAIPSFKNDTYIPRLEVLMADSTIKQFQQDGTYEIVPDYRADAILTCVLKSVEKGQARAVLSNVLATREFSLKLRVEYELTDRVTGRTLLKGDVLGSTSFFNDADLQTDQNQAIVTAIHEVAVDLAGEITEGF